MMALRANSEGLEMDDDEYAKLIRRMNPPRYNFHFDLFENFQLFFFFFLKINRIFASGLCFFRLGFTPCVCFYLGLCVFL